jgi:hypothetical protein
MTDKDKLIQRIGDPGTGGTHGREAARAELDVILTQELTDHLNQLSADINHSKKVLAENIAPLTGELLRLREQMADSSRIASQQTGALVTWTRILVCVTGILKCTPLSRHFFEVFKVVAVGRWTAVF